MTSLKCFSTQTDSLPIPLNILAGQTLTQLEEKAAAAAAALKAVTGKDEKDKPATTTTTTTKTTTTVETVVVTTGTEPPPPAPVVPTPTPPAPTPAAADVKRDDDVAVADPANPDTAGTSSDPAASPEEPSQTGLTDPADRGSIFLGLRVYTHRDAPAVLAGQLRHEMNTSFAGLALASV